MDNAERALLEGDKKSCRGWERTSEVDLLPVADLSQTYIYTNTHLAVVTGNITAAGITDGPPLGLQN